MKRWTWGLSSLILGFTALAVVALKFPHLLNFNFSLTHQKNIETKERIRQLKIGLAQYFQHCGQFPTQEQGLKALLKAPENEPRCRLQFVAPFLEDAGTLKDAWGREFEYSSSWSGYEIISRGDDGAPGGTGLDEDITSSNLN